MKRSFADIAIGRLFVSCLTGTIYQKKSLSSAWIYDPYSEAHTANVVRCSGATPVYLISEGI